MHPSQNLSKSIALPNSYVKAIYILVWNQNCISFSIPLIPFPLITLILFRIPFSIIRLSAGKGNGLSPCFILFLSLHTAYNVACLKSISQAEQAHLLPFLIHNECHYLRPDISVGVTQYTFGNIFSNLSWIGTLKE